MSDKKDKMGKPGKAKAPVKGVKLEKSKGIAMMGKNKPGFKKGGMIGKKGC